MPTQEEYLKAKAIVEAYEQEQFEDGMRQADFDLEEGDPFVSDESCLACGHETDHYRGCPYDESPFALLCREGYD